MSAGACHPERASLHGPCAASSTQNAHSRAVTHTRSIRAPAAHIGFPRVAQLGRLRPSVTRERVSPRCMVSMPGGGRKGRPRLAVLVYRRDMPARKRPTTEDALTARRALLDGLARDADIFEVLSGLAPCTRATTRSLARCSFTSLRRRWSGAGPAGPSRCTWRDCASGSCPRRPSADGGTRSSSTQCWPQRVSTGGPSRICLMRSPRGRLTTSGSTPCTRRSPTSAPPPSGRAS